MSNDYALSFPWTTAIITLTQLVGWKVEIQASVFPPTPTPVNTSCQPTLVHVLKGPSHLLYVAHIYVHTNINMSVGVLFFEQPTWATTTTTRHALHSPGPSCKVCVYRHSTLDSLHKNAIATSLSLSHSDVLLKGDIGAKSCFPVTKATTFNSIKSFSQTVSDNFSESTWKILQII